MDGAIEDVDKRVNGGGRGGGNGNMLCWAGLGWAGKDCGSDGNSVFAKAIF